MCQLLSESTLTSFPSLKTRTKGDKLVNNVILIFHIIQGSQAGWDKIPNLSAFFGGSPNDKYNIMMQMFLAKANDDDFYDANDDSFENDENDDRNNDNDNAGVFLAELVVLAKLIMRMKIAMMTMVIMMNMMTFMMISTTLYSRCVPGTARCSGEAECTDASDEFEYVKDERIMMMMKLGADLF